jgi:translation initiation factor 1 (eIF-1/SUI1)
MTFGVPLTLYHQAVKDPEILISTAQKKGRKVVTTISGLKGFGTDTSCSPAASSSV